MKIKKEVFEIRGTALEGVNPLPRFRARKPNVVATGENFPEYLKESLGYQTKVLPYMMQDRYSRKRDVLKLKSFVLENEFLKARFFPEYGGRLHSLYDKKAKRELLFTNSVIQPCNLAIRDAWLSGGIEWNIGNFGHTYTTCDNVFAAVLDDGQGNDFLRIYEFERNKSIFWQVDFHLPDGSAYLVSHVKMVNPFDRDTTTYWWSNIAVPTGENTRVIASNKSVISFIGNTCMCDVLPEVTAFKGIDVTYPNNAPKAFDYFILKEKDGESTWEAAAYDDGLVFYERSSAPLYYKKLFAWGNHHSGRHWQEVLSDGKGTGYYAELQAGIAPSQVHDMLLPANSKYEWTQCFGGVKCDKDELFGDYNVACDYFDKKLSTIMSEDKINELDKLYTSLATVKVKETDLLHKGSGFGALEIMRMKKDCDGQVPEWLCFPADSIGNVESQWLRLLESDSMPKISARELPVSYMVSEKWLSRLKSAAEAKDADWSALMHYGIAVYEYQDTTRYVNKVYNQENDNKATALAESLWLRAVELKPNVWCYRNLAILAEQRLDFEKAEEYYDEALKIEGVYDDYSIASEYIIFLIKTKKYEKVWKIFENLPDNCKRADRIKISVAVAAVKLGKFDYLEKFFAEEHYAIAEGEDTLTDVWFEYSARLLAKERGINNLSDEKLNELIDEAWETCPPDYSIDFRLSLARKDKYRVEQ